MDRCMVVFRTRGEASVPPSVGVGHAGMQKHDSRAVRVNYDASAGCRTWTGMGRRVGLVA